MLIKDITHPQILITLAKDIGKGEFMTGYDFAVIVITQAYMDRTPYEDIHRGEVRVQSVRQGFTYANGINHGMSTAGVASLPIVVDSRFELPAK